MPDERRRRAHAPPLPTRRGPRRRAGRSGGDGPEHTGGRARSPAGHGRRGRRGREGRRTGQSLLWEGEGEEREREGRVAVRGEGEAEGASAPWLLLISPVVCGDSTCTPRRAPLDPSSSPARPPASTAHTRTRTRLTSQTSTASEHRAVQRLGSQEEPPEGDGLRLRPLGLLASGHRLLDGPANRPTTTM